MLVFLIILFLLLSAFFSGSEIAFVSANKLGIELKREKGKRRGRIMASYYDKPDFFLSTMLVGNNIALVIFTILMERLLRPALITVPGGEVAQLLIATLVSTVVVLLFGEFLPKTMFRIFADEAVYALTYPHLFFSKTALTNHLYCQ